ncbi:MAG: phospho-N-acetylmuramoyl-pentapeptide-transferase [Gammaproteobacteria bacterium AqS3]|nr:phospho-N-acetylmuramoyl-pentapeptide-transferase [Gammaproteobacteria bacterium AqS3]
MLIWLAEQLGWAVQGGGDDPLGALLLRALLGLLTAVIVALIIGRITLRVMRRLQIGEEIYELGPQQHFSKRGTPTMGGLSILLGLLIAIGLWVDLGSRHVWLLVLAALGFGAIGFYDDWLKSIAKRGGLSARGKMLGQTLLALIIAAALYLGAETPGETRYLLPLFSGFSLDLGLGFIFVTWLVIVGSSNAVNLTDGLDGLASMSSALVALGLGVIACIVSSAAGADYIRSPHIEGAGEIAVFAAALIGALLGFLCFNAYPARIFMGDVGSLALGGVLGSMAVMLRQEVLFALMGALFVVETVSVMLQVASFRLTGKRIFRMAPIHHHFEQKGMPETHIVVRAWILTILCVLIGLGTLLLR